MSESEKSAAGHEAWRAARTRELASPDSWLGLTGLYWLEQGTNSVGTAAASSVLLPRGPQFFGKLVVAGETVTWFPQEGSEKQLVNDALGAPDIVECDGLAFFIIARDGRLAVRVRDRRWAEGNSSVAIPCHPFAADWVVDAAWLPIDPPKSLEVPNVSGDLEAVEVRWQAVFTHAGQAVSLLPMAVGEDGIFFVFRDRSSGKKSYGAGRFLKTAPPREGRIVLDFNRAYNPPCAFTPFATCPLPPPENWLPMAVNAGEMTPRKELPGDTLGLVGPMVPG